MAVVGPSRHSRGASAATTMSAVSMSLMQGAAGPTVAAAGGNGGAAAAAVAAGAQAPHAAQPYYHPQHAAAPAHTQEQVQPDRPIGYGAFGVVW